MQIFDTHAHYFDQRFERESGADAILSTILPSPVSEIVNVATNPTNARLAIEQAAKYEGMYAAIGIHPEDCHYIGDIDAALGEIYAMLGNADTRRRDKLVALGEIGLDYHWQEYDGIPMDKQKQAYVFEKQMEMAEVLGLPVIIHDREAHGDCFETVLKYPRVKGVFHSYSGSAEMAHELVRRGWYISFSGTLTFKNAVRVREAAMAVPRDRLMIETDAPFLAPHPMRGSLNHSGLLIHVLDTLSALWQCTPEEAAVQTRENAKAFFGL